MRKSNDGAARTISIVNSFVFRKLHTYIDFYQKIDCKIETFDTKYRVLKFHPPLAKVDGLAHAQQIQEFLVVTFSQLSKVLNHGDTISQMIKEVLANAMIIMVQGKNNLTSNQIKSNHSR